MTFQPGQSGNLKGRPKGIIDNRSQIRALLQVHANDLINKLIEMAKSGEPSAMKLCIERLIPRLKPDDSITFELPDGRLDSPDNMIKVAEDITLAVTSGQLSLDEARNLTNFLDLQRDAIKEAEWEKN